MYDSLQLTWEVGEKSSGKNLPGIVQICAKMSSSPTLHPHRGWDEIEVKLQKYFPRN